MSDFESLVAAAQERENARLGHEEQSRKRREETSCRAGLAIQELALVSRLLAASDEAIRDAYRVSFEGEGGRFAGYEDKQRNAAIREKNKRDLEFMLEHSQPGWFVAGRNVGADIESQTGEDYGGGRMLMYLLGDGRLCDGHSTHRYPTTAKPYNSVIKLFGEAPAEYVFTDRNCVDEIRKSLANYVVKYHLDIRSA